MVAEKSKLESRLDEGKARLPEGVESAAELDEALEEGTGKVAEIVGETGEKEGSGMPASTKKDDAGDDTKPSGLASIAGKVADLLRSKPKPVALPSAKVQQKKIEKYIRKETARLIKESEKLQRKKNYSPAKLEEMVSQIRHLRKVLAELLSATAKKVEGLYRQYILRQS